MKRIIFLLITCVFAIALVRFAAPGEEPAQYVNTRTLATATVLNRVSCGGELRAIRSRTLAVAGYAVVDRIYVKEGDSVKKGQLLMTYSSAGDFTVDSDFDSADILEAANILDREEIAKLADAMSGGLKGYIEAPFDGMVARIEPAEGEQISPFIGALQICDTSRIQAVLRVNESELGMIAVGMPVTVSGGTFSDTRDGVVVAVSPVITTKTSLSGTNERYGEVTVEMLDCDGLYPGASVNAQISVSRITGAIVIPYSAIDQDEQGNEFVYLLSNGHAEKRIITTAEDLGNEVRAASGLAAGEMLIVDSPSDIDTSRRIAPLEDRDR